MRIVNKRTPKKTKLRVFTCIICNEQFGSYIKKHKTCSKDCKNKLNSISKSKWVYRQCVRCGNDFKHKPSEDRRGYIHMYCSKKCLVGIKKLGLPSGFTVGNDGYVLMNHNVGGKRKQVRYHRYLIEQSIGRKLLSTEIVHHKDHNILNNELSNLEIMTRAEHNTLHLTLKYSTTEGRERMLKNNYFLRKFNKTFTD